MIKTLEEFSLSLGQSFVQKIAEKIIRRVIIKSLDITPEIELKDLHAWSDGDRMTVLLTARTELSKDDILKLIKL